ncbi:RNA polymerase sigma factor [Nonomuraea zeae]|uniref:RNA polymerase sigma factor n=1 Tax=Nonomuraea zeae TaxID=1642303 RepID=UPI001479661F|nr:sigma-70 family RNA polymerase sigma factor [Nonomuraea zeae]
MPGWPTVDRADDHELVEALRRVDADAPARLYDSYAERLHDYACSLAGQRDLAADAVHDALVTAQGCVQRLKEPARLRAWLYALTRFQVRARMAHRSGTPAHGMPLPELDEQEDPELADLVRETLGELSRNEREVLELSTRHGLTPSEVGAVLGLTSRQAAARLGRARDLLENAAAAVVLARTGRAHCPDLSAMVDSWEGPLTPLLRRRLSGHIGGCEVCTEGRHRQVSAGRLLNMVPIAYPPISLRRRVVDTCVNPERDQTRTLITDRGDSFDRSGFPVAVEPRSRRRRPRRLAPVVLAGVCVLAATGAMVVINGRDASDSTALRPSATPTSSGTDPSPTPEPVLDTGEATPEPTPAPSRTPSDRVSPGGRPAATRPSTKPAAVPTATRRRPVPGARLAAACPRAIDGAAKIGLSARNASVSWVATAAEGLDVFPASGSIKAGGSVTVWVTVVDPNGSGSGRVSITSNAGPATCSLSWDGRDPQSSEPPSDQPTPSTDPSETPTGAETSSVNHEQTEALGE